MRPASAAAAASAPYLPRSIHLRSSTYKLHAQPPSSPTKTSHELGTGTPVLQDSQDLVDLADTGDGGKVVVTITETMPFRWAPNIASYKLDQGA